MKSRTNALLKIAITAVAFFFIASGICLGGDLDDGISKYTDESISKDDELGQKDLNLKYIILKAKKDGKKSGSDGTGNMNSVVSYGDIKGDITIIDMSKGDKTQVVGN